MAKIIGADRHRNRLKRMQSATPQAVLAALYVLGQEIEIEAEISITSGSISGKGHVPSAPGDPPNADTRTLDTNIETTIEAQNPPTVHVTSNAPYSAALEWGTSRMAERPFMRPAATKKRARGPQLVGRAVSQVIRSS